MSEESKQELHEESPLSKACHCKAGCAVNCTAKKILFVLCGALLVVGIVWLAIACPSCH